MSAPVIHIQNTRIQYGSLTAIDDVSLDINAGEVLALLGENGAGKSTLISALLGRLKPSSGTVSVFGQPPGSMFARQRTGVILQQANLPETNTVAEQLNLFRHYYPNPMSMKALLDSTQLAGLEQRRFSQLSGGQKQRVFFALAICGNPDLVFLDEPTVGLDSTARKEFWHCIRSLKTAGKTIILTTHYLEEAEALADKIVLLHQGRIARQGTPEQLKSQAKGKKVSFTCLKDMEKLVLLINEMMDHQSPHTSIRELEVINNRVNFVSERPEEFLSRLFKQDIVVENIHIANCNLEDAVISLNRVLKQQDIANGEAA